MKKNNHIGFLSCLAFALVAVFALSAVLVGCDKTDVHPAEPGAFDALKGQSDSVILFIGDGMGENHVKVAEAYLEKDMFFSGFATAGYMSTNCLSNFQATDSAAAASAMATGEKYSRGAVSFKNGKNVDTISEYAKSIGKGVGIVTTDVLSGATPAGFSAHSANRSNKDEIVESQLNSGIDLFLGTGVNNDDAEDTVHYADYKSRFEAKGYAYCDKFDQLSLDCDKIVGAFSEIASFEPTNETPTLAQLAAFAVDFLENKYPNGYFLMIEGAYIDKASSKKDVFGMVEYLDAFDDSVEAVSEKLKDKNHAMIVTADHETGDLQYNGESKDEISNALFNVSYHSKADVRFFVDFRLKTEGFVMPDKIDNTDVFTICKNLIDPQ